MAKTLLDLLSDPEAAAFAPPVAQDMRQKPSNIGVLNAGLAGIGDLAYSAAGFPVDLSAGLMQALGFNVGNTVGGSDWIKQKATQYGIRPPESADPTLRDVRLGAEIMSGGIDPFATAKGIGMAGSAIAREAAPMVGRGLENYVNRVGLNANILPPEAAARVMGQTRAVNEAGLPQVYYRGARSQYDPLSSAGANEASKSGDIGLWMSKSPELASSYTGSQGLGHVSPAYVNLKNPLVIDAGESLWSQIPSKSVEDALGVKLSSPTVTTDQVSRIAKQRGFDGVQFKNVIDVKGGKMSSEAAMQPTDVVVAFDPKAARSALSDKAIAGAAGVSQKAKAPTQQSVQKQIAQAPVSGSGFYSAVEQAALNLEKKSGTGQGLLNELMKAPDVKKDEMAAIGLVDAFKDKPKATKQELIDYIGQNKVELSQSRLGGPEPFDKNRLTELESEYRSLKQHPIDDPSFGEEKYNELIKLLNVRDQSTTQSLYDAAEQATLSAQRAQRQGHKKTAEKYFREAEFLNTRAEKLDLQGQGMRNPPRYDQYKLPGGTNYQETLLTLPTKRELPSGYKVMQNPSTAPNAQKYIVVDKSGERYGSGSTESDALNKYFEYHTTDAYKSSHWDQPNVLAHLRTQDFVDADGKNMRLIEEVQSDWHQAGREKGYKTSQSERKATSAIRKDGYWEVRDQNNEFVTNIQDYRMPDADEAKALEVANARIQQDHATNVASSGMVPDAPMKETWYQTALRKAVKDAIDAGQDRVGITTGARQAERYDLSKQVDELLYKRNEDGTYKLSAQARGSANMLGDAIPESKLSDYVGKEVAKSITQGSGKDMNLGGSGSISQPKDMWKSMSGIDLKIGGEGMKKYYDEMYPKYLDKFAKKYGATVKEGSLQDKEPVKYIDITPEMRKAFGGKDKGVPLFQAAPLIPVGIGAGGLIDQLGERPQ